MAFSYNCLQILKKSKPHLIKINYLIVPESLYFACYNHTGVNEVQSIKEMFWKIGHTDLR